MEDLHRNIFYSYSQGGIENFEEERILENNVTKAFINTLEHINNNIAKNILSEILRKKLNGKSPEFDLQILDNENIKNKKNKKAYKWMLVITPNGKEDLIEKHKNISPDVFDRFNSFIIKINREKDEKKKLSIKDELQNLSISFNSKELTQVEIQKLYEDLSDLLVNNCNVKLDYRIIDREEIFTITKYLFELTCGSIPDGWVMLGNNIILIENKIKGRVYEYQLDRHIRDNLGIETKKVHHIYKSWREIYNIFNKYKKNHFLINQFLKYLEVWNLGPIKFEQRDFHSFYQQDDDSKELRYIAREKLKTLVDDINKKQLSDDFDVQKGHLSDEYIGVELVERVYSSNKKVSQLVHPSVGLRKDMIVVYLTILDKSLTKKLVKKIKNDSNYNKRLDNSINSLKPALDVKAKIKISEKWHFHMGKDYYLDSFISEINVNDTIFEKAIEIMDEINNKSNENLKKLFEQDYNPGFTGVFSIEYQLYWLFVINMEIRIKEFISSAVLNLMPTYKILSELLNTKV